MHSALKDYYKLRGMYNKSELSRMEAENSKNSIKVRELQQQMDEALDKISHFLKDQMDPKTAQRIAMAKVEREDQSETHGQTPVAQRESTNFLAVPETTNGALSRQVTSVAAC